MLQEDSLAEIPKNKIFTDNFEHILKKGSKSLAGTLAEIDKAQVDLNVLFNFWYGECLKISWVKLPEKHVALPPLILEYLDSFDFENLRLLYKMLFASSSVVKDFFIPHFFTGMTR